MEVSDGNGENRSVRLALQEATESIWKKLQLFFIALLHFLFSGDKQTHGNVEASAKKDDNLAASNAAVNHGDPTRWVLRKQKRVIFIRHAESEWNVVFNRGLRLAAVVSFIRALLREVMMLPSWDSIFIDSPLSLRGHKQARSLYDHVGARVHAAHEGGVQDPPEQLLAYLCSPLPSSIIVTSNLRRAIDTARIASAARLETPGERIHVLSSLQEIGRNVDTLALSDAYAIRPETLSKSMRMDKDHDELFNLSESHGNKSVLGSGQQRLRAFAKWVFEREEDVVIVYGHSHWFRSFCQEYFPLDVYHEAKERKLPNCSVVSFVFEERRWSERIMHRINPERFDRLH